VAAGDGQACGKEQNDFPFHKAFCVVGFLWFDAFWALNDASAESLQRKL
jgi:hypothetical protein